MLPSIKRSPEYLSWKAMIERCTKPGHPSYKYYGGRGISVCREWLSFESFISDMGLRTKEKPTLERINNDGNYCPANCKWASWREQMRNTRRKTLLTFNGETLRLIDWCAKLNIHRATLCNRLGKLGWTVEKALSTPTDKTKYRRGNTIASRAKAAGIHRNYVYARIKKGMLPEDALHAAILYRDEHR